MKMKKSLIINGYLFFFWIPVWNCTGFKIVFNLTDK
jgi:hypothetical protein